jgi:hypothetical protein
MKDLNESLAVAANDKQVMVDIPLPEPSHKEITVLS